MIFLYIKYIQNLFKNEEKFMNLTIDKYKSVAAKNYKVIPIMKEILADTQTPVTIFLKCKEKGDSFVLESVEQKEGLGDYSIIGYQAKLVTYYKNGQLYIHDKKVKTDEKNPLHKVNNEFINKNVYRNDDMPPFIGGLVGYVSYETVRFFDKVNMGDKKGLDIPDFAYYWADNIISVDNMNQKIQIMVLTYPNKNNVEEVYKAGCDKINEIVETLRSDFKMPQKEFEEMSEVKLKSNIKKEDFYEKVKKCKEYIKAGDAFQIVLSQRFTAETKFSPFTIYRSLRSVNPSPYMYFFDFDEFKIIGASPEVMVKLDLDNNILLKPIAGTRPRGKNKKEDLSLEKELMNDEKEVAEHIMLVDLGRNDIGRISIPGSVTVSNLMDVERYSHVMHIVSTVTGKVENQFNWVNALEATFPAGTLSGAPKIRAMEIINELEPTKRGPYGGSVMFVSVDGILNSCITIRTLVHKDEKIYGQAGAGIVADSVPGKEYLETVNKVKAVFTSVYKLRENKIL